MGWSLPSWVAKLNEKKELTDEEQDELDSYINEYSIYGTEEYVRIRVRFTVINETFSERYSYGYSTRASTAGGDDL